MPEDQPVIVSGGSLVVKTRKKLKEKGKKHDREDYDYPDAGELRAVDIDGKRYDVSPNSVITIITWVDDATSTTKS